MRFSCYLSIMLSQMNDKTMAKHWAKIFILNIIFFTVSVCMICFSLWPNLIYSVRFDLRETKLWTLLMPVLCFIACFHLLLSGHFSYTVRFEKCEVNHGLEQRHRLLRVTRLTQKMALLGKDI